MLPINQILCGDAYTLIREIPDNSVQLVITSPPYYQQRDYGGGIGNEASLDEYLERLIAILKECTRVISEEGSIVFNLGDKYDEGNLLLVPYRFAVEATQKTPLKLVNNITWVKQNPTPRQFRRRLVSSTEPFFHFAKSDRYYYDIDRFLNEERPKKAKNGASSKLGQRYFELIESSSLSSQEKQQARLELAEIINEVKTGQIEGFRMKIRGIHSEPFGGQAGGRQIQLEKKGFTLIRIHGNPMKKDVIEMPVESLKGSNHPAIYPARLVAEFLKMLTRKNDLVLDPFMGAGSTAVACKLLERRYIGFELNPAYCQFAEERLENTTFTPTLF